MVNIGDRLRDHADQIGQLPLTTRSILWRLLEDVAIEEVESLFDGVVLRVCSREQVSVEVLAGKRLLDGGQASIVKRLRSDVDRVPIKQVVLNPAGRHSILHELEKLSRVRCAQVPRPVHDWAGWVQ